MTQLSPLQQQWKTLKEANNNDDEASATLQNTQYYAMADGLAHVHIYAHLEAYEHPKYALFEHDELTAEQQPWLFPLYEKDSFSDWYLQESMGNYWGVILSSSLPLVQLGEHLHHHLIAQDEHNKRHLIRLYDPRALHPFLSVLSSEQSTEFIALIHGIWTDDSGKLGHWRHYYYHENKIHFIQKHVYIEYGTEKEACPC